MALLSSEASSQRATKFRSLTISLLAIPAISNRSRVRLRCTGAIFVTIRTLRESSRERIASFISPRCLPCRNQFWIRFRATKATSTAPSMFFVPRPKAKWDEWSTQPLRLLMGTHRCCRKWNRCCHTRNHPTRSRNWWANTMPACSRTALGSKQCRFVFSTSSARARIPRAFTPGFFRFS